MEKKMKIVTGILVVLLIGSTIALAPMLFAEETELNIEENPTEQHAAGYRRKVRHNILIYILRNGEYTQLTGTVVLQKGPIVILQLPEETVNILLPPFWVTEGEILNRAEIFDGDPLSAGDTITVDTLKATYTRDTYDITAFFTFGISGEAFESDALLPFNINPAG
jgi:hypothetical protein